MLCSNRCEAGYRSASHEVYSLHLKLCLNSQLLVMHIADMPCQINPVSGIMSTTSRFGGCNFKELEAFLCQLPSARLTGI